MLPELNIDLSHMQYYLVLLGVSGLLFSILKNFARLTRRTARMTVKYIKRGKRKTKPIIRAIKRANQNKKRKTKNKK